MNETLLLIGRLQGDLLRYQDPAGLREFLHRVDELDQSFAYDPRHTTDDVELLAQLRACVVRARAEAEIGQKPDLDFARVALARLRQSIQLREEASRRAERHEA